MAETIPSATREEATAAKVCQNADFQKAIQLVCLRNVLPILFHQPVQEAAQGEKRFIWIRFSSEAKLVAVATHYLTTRTEFLSQKIPLEVFTLANLQNSIQAIEEAVRLDSQFAVKGTHLKTIPEYWREVIMDEELENLQRTVERGEWRADSYVCGIEFDLDADNFSVVPSSLCTHTISTQLPPLSFLGHGLKRVLFPLGPALPFSFSSFSSFSSSSGPTPKSPTPKSERERGKGSERNAKQDQKGEKEESEEESIFAVLELAEVHQMSQVVLGTLGLADCVPLVEFSKTQNLLRLEPGEHRERLWLSLNASHVVIEQQQQEQGKQPASRFELKEFVKSLAQLRPRARFSVNTLQHPRTTFPKSEIQIRLESFLILPPGRLKVTKTQKLSFRALGPKRKEKGKGAKKEEREKREKGEKGEKKEKRDKKDGKRK